MSSYSRRYIKRAQIPARHTYSRCTCVARSDFLHVGHFLLVLRASAMHSWQNTCPQTVDAMFLTPMTSMQITHFMPEPDAPAPAPALAAPPPPPPLPLGGESNIIHVSSGAPAASALLAPPPLALEAEAGGGGGTGTSSSLLPVRSTVVASWSGGDVGSTTPFSPRRRRFCWLVGWLVVVGEVRRVSEEGAWFSAAVGV
jgi:hypothetical protein